MESPLLSPQEYDLMMQNTSQMKDFAEIIKLMLNNPKIPLSTQHNRWGYINKNTMLARTDRRDAIRGENRFGLQMLYTMMGMRYHKIDFMMLAQFHNEKNCHSLMMNRSQGGFERLAETTQVHQLITNRVEEPKQSGFFTGLKRKLGFGKKEEQYGG